MPVVSLRQQGPIAVAAAALAAVCLIAAVGWVIIPGSAAPRSFDGDEANHATWGAVVALDLQRGDIPSLLRHTYEQNRYPPLFSYLQAPFILALGITPQASRVTGVVIVPALCLALWLCVVTIAPGRFRSAGAGVAVLLALSCPLLLLVAASAYMDTACLALMMLVYGAYLRAGPAHSRGWAWVAGLAHLAIWGTKFQFGLLVSVSLVAHLLIVHRCRWREIAGDRSARIALLPAWGAMLLWLANPLQAREFLMYLTWAKPHAGLTAMALQSFPLQARRLFTSYSANPVVAVGLIAAFGYGLARARRSPAVALLVVSTVVAFVGTVRLSEPFERLGLWFLPPLWVLAGLGVSEGFEALMGAPAKWRRRVGKSLAVGAIIVTVAGAMASERRAIGQINAEAQQPTLWPAARFVTGIISPDKRTALVNCWGRDLGPLTLKWEYLSQYGAQGLDFDSLNIWEYPPPDPSAERTLHLRWPWQVRQPRDQAGQRTRSTADVLSRARIDAVVYCPREGKWFSAEEHEAMDEIERETGFRCVAGTSPEETGMSLVVYERKWGGWSR